ncbi:MAG: hypothetical protein ABSF79_05390 [Smithellaceae bacterium]
MTSKETIKFKEAFEQKYPSKKIGPVSELLLVTIPKIIIKYGQSKNYDVDCSERFTYIGENASTKMVSFVFDCEYKGLPDGYGGENPASVLAKVYPDRVLKTITEDYIDINKVFEEQPESKKKYIEYKKQIA